MMIEHKFLHTVNGRTYFAAVSIRVEDADRSTVSVDIEIDCNRDDGEITALTHPDWVAAAVDGAETVLDRDDFSPRSKKVSICSIRGNEADTTADTVKCASILAVWKGLFPQRGLPDEKFDGKWSIDFD